MIERSRIEAAVCRILGPYLGETMARAAVDGHWQRLTPGCDALEADQLDRFVDRLRKGLTLFVGTENADHLMDRLKVEIGIAG